MSPALSSNRIFISTPPRRGFTLIEIVVVLAIIGILSALAMMVGKRVVESGRIDLTKSLLRVLDKTQDSYFADRDAKVPYKYTDTSQLRNEFGIIDGRLGPPTADRGLPSERAEPSTTFYLLATNEATSVQSAVGGIDSRFVVRAPIDNVAPPAANSDPNNFTTIYTKSLVKPQTSTAGEIVNGLVIKDPWGNAIRYVHPKFQGGYGAFAAPGAAPALPAGRDATFNTTSTAFSLKQGPSNFAAMFRRSFRPFDGSLYPSDTGDADEGLSTGGRGYFYSPGPDKDPGTRGDNVYIDVPQFPSETAKYN